MMRPSIIDLLDDEELLGPSFIGASWDRWRSVLKAGFALEMSERDRALFDEVSGGREPPRDPVSELVFITGRGGGKDSIAAAIAIWAASTGDYSRLRAGEKAIVLCLAVDRDQATIVFDYIKAAYEAIPLLASQVEGRISADTINLRSGASIIVSTNSYRAVRGRTIAVSIYDEVAYWRDRDFANPDTEVDAAVQPGLLRWPGSLKILISSPYRRSGLLFDKWRQSFGQDDPDCLVVVGASRMFNPTLSETLIARELRSDPERARAEWLAEWRNDVAAFLTRESVEACVAFGVYQRGALPGVSYRCFVDPSGGERDAFTAAVGHFDVRTQRGILDALRIIKGPCSPDAATAEISELAKSYGVVTVQGDHYAGKYPADRFKAHGVNYKVTDLPRNEIYRKFLPLLLSGEVELLDNQQMVAEFCGLMRRTGFNGSDTIGHPNGAHDDACNVVAGVMVDVCTDTLRWYRVMARQDAERSGASVGPLGAPARPAIRERAA